MRDTCDVKPSQRHLRNAELIHVFREAYVDLLNSSRKAEDEYFQPVLLPATDHITYQRKRTAVAVAAGGAASAYHEYGGTMSFRNAAVIMRDVDPVANWEMSLRDPKQMRPETVISAVETAESRARLEATDAARRERGLTGLIAAFLRWPSTLREAVGYGHPGQRTAAGVIGVLGQVFVTGVAGAVTLGIVAGIVALWRLVF